MREYSADITLYLGLHRCGGSVPAKTDPAGDEGRCRCCYRGVREERCFLPKLIQRAMKADADAAIEVVWKNEQVKKVGVRSPTVCL